MSYEIDWVTLESHHPDEFIAARESANFIKSEHGVRVKKQLEELLVSTKEDVVATLNAGEDDAARAGASLVAGIEATMGILYENALIVAEALSAKGD